MRSRYRINNEYAAHFITSTIVEWLPVFTTAACRDIVVGSFQYCRQRKGLRVHAWVILDNHFHAIVSGPELTQTLADLKKFTAREILDQL
jgi:REP-associated tyrosine transposase